jgi:hypothetical protein
MPTDTPSVPTPQDHSDPVTDLFAKLGTYVDTTDPELVTARTRFLEAVKRRLPGEKGAQ